MKLRNLLLYLLAIAGIPSSSGFYHGPSPFSEISFTSKALISNYMIITPQISTFSPHWHFLTLNWNSQYQLTINTINLPHSKLNSLLSHEMFFFFTNQLISSIHLISRAKNLNHLSSPQSLHFMQLPVTVNLFSKPIAMALCKPSSLSLATATASHLSPHSHSQLLWFLEGILLTQPTPPHSLSFKCPQPLNAHMGK